MKYVLILTLMLLVAGYFYWRLRPYFQTARRIFGAVRDVRRVRMNETPAGAGFPPRASQTPSAQQLARCAACGTWTPAARAVSLRSSDATYCSHACLERAAADESRARKSAS